MQTLDLTDLPDDAIVPYVRIYSALYNLVSMNELDAEYGDRHIYLNQLRMLEQKVWKKYAKSTTIKEWASWLNVAYTLHQTTSTRYTSAQDDELWNTATALIDNYLSSQVRINDDVIDEEECFAIMQLIFTQWYGYVEEESEEVPEPIVFARQQLTNWASECSTDGTWKNLSEKSALRRIALFQMNATMLLDDNFDETLDKAFQHYVLNGESIENIEKETIKYNVIQQSNLSNPQYGELLDKIAKSLESQYENITDSMLKLQVCSVLVDHQTWRISESVQLSSFV